MTFNNYPMFFKELSQRIAQLQQEKEECSGDLRAKSARCAELQHQVEGGKFFVVKKTFKFLQHCVFALKIFKFLFFLP